MLANPSATNAITRDIIGGAIRIHKTLGPGLLESAYAACLALELSECGHTIELKKAQMLTYLRLTQCPVGLLINFNVQVLKNGIRRIINSMPQACP